jgi:hypothetical protein
MNINIIDNIISFEYNSGLVFYLENVDENFIHIGFGNGMVVGFQVVENQWNGLSFNNSTDLIAYLNSIIEIPEN